MDWLTTLALLAAGASGPAMAWVVQWGHTNQERQGRLEAEAEATRLAEERKTLLRERRRLPAPWALRRPVLPVAAVTAEQPAVGAVPGMRTVPNIPVGGAR